MFWGWGWGWGWGKERKSLIQLAKPAFRSQCAHTEQSEGPMDTPKVRSAIHNGFESMQNKILLNILRFPYTFGPP